MGGVPVVSGASGPDVAGIGPPGLQVPAEAAGWPRVASTRPSQALFLSDFYSTFQSSGVVILIPGKGGAVGGAVRVSRKEFGRGAGSDSGLGRQEGWAGRPLTGEAVPQGHLSASGQSQQGRGRG